MTAVGPDDPNPFRPTLTDKWALDQVDVAPVNAIHDTTNPQEPLLFLRITATDAHGETAATDYALDLPNAATLLVALTDGAARAFGRAATHRTCERIRAAYLTGT